MSTHHPVTFISYAYDSPKHEEWVRQLAHDLRTRYGVDILLDKYELAAGRELTYFMETAIERATKVLVILTPGYKAKAGDRKGGAGYEFSMISKEMMATQVGSDKFIPVLRTGTVAEAAPLYLQGRIYHDMRPEISYEPALYKLAMLLYGEPEFKKPALGPIPDFTSPATDPHLYELQQLSAATQEAERMRGLLNSPEGLDRALSESHRVFALLEEKSARYRQVAPGFGFYHDSTERQGYREARIVAANHTVMVIWQQKYSNTSDGSTLRVLYLAGNIPFNIGELPPSRRPTGPLQENTYTFFLGPREAAHWKTGRDTYTTDEIAQEVFTFLMEKVKQAQAAKQGY